MVIFQIIIKYGAHAQNLKSPFLYIFLLFWINVTQILTLKTAKKYFFFLLIIVSSWNHDLMFMLECPLSHYWTSPLTIANYSSIVKLVINQSNCSILYHVLMNIFMNFLLFTCDFFFGLLLFTFVFPYVKRCSDQVVFISL